MSTISAPSSTFFYSAFSGLAMTDDPQHQVAVTLRDKAGVHPSPAQHGYQPSARSHPADGVFLLDLGCSKIMTIASVSVMKMITITTPRGVTIGSGFRITGSGAA
jgi:hypothetical protein